MNIKINGNQNDVSAMLLSAERYALGRKTYIVNWTCDFIIKNKHLLTENDKLVMIKDIKEQENFGYGDDCDKNDWLKLLKTLKGE